MARTRSEAPNSISPTQYARLETCELRFVLDRNRANSKAVERPATVLGRCAHLALERLVSTGRIRNEETLEADSFEAWDWAVSKVFAVTVAPSGIPGYYLKMARLPNAARRLHDLISGFDQLEPEVAMESRDGRIKGKADLVATGAEGVLVVDYKSGVDRDPDSHEPTIGPFATQIRLYAYLVEQTRRVWPFAGVILPFDGDPISIDVDPSACNAVALAAMQTLDRVNAPGFTAAGSPSPEVCKYCPHPVRCDAFRVACTPAWTPQLAAVLGEVISREEAKDGSFSLAVRVLSGTVDASQVALTRVSPASHPAVRAAQPGVRVAAVGLIPGAAQTVFRLKTSGTLGVAEVATLAPDHGIGAGHSP